MLTGRLQARYFKTMMKEADHLGKVKRLRVPEIDVDPLKPAYEVRLRGRDMHYSFADFGACVVLHGYADGAGAVKGVLCSVLLKRLV